MKKIICILIAVLLVGSLIACGASNDNDPASNPETTAGNESFVWERLGYFSDESNMVYISASDDAENPGFNVGCMIEEGMFSKILSLDGKSLHGNIAGEGEDEVVVTITYEGEDGILFAVEGGNTYTLAHYEIPVAAFSATINTKGDGEIAYAKAGETPEFDDEFPSQSAYIGLAEAETYTLSARPEEGWKFVKWTLNGEDLSAEATVTVEITEDSEFVAVFGRKGTDETHVDLEKVTTLGELLGLANYGYTATEDVYVIAFEQDWIFYRAVAELPEETSKAIFELDWDDPEYEAKTNALISPLKVTLIENLTENIPTEEELDKLVGKTGEELLNDGWYVSGRNLETMEFSMNHKAYAFKVVFEGTVEDADGFDDEDIGPFTVKSVTFEDYGDLAYND